MKLQLQLDEAGRTNAGIQKTPETEGTYSLITEHEDEEVEPGELVLTLSNQEIPQKRAFVQESESCYLSNSTFSCKCRDWAVIVKDNGLYENENTSLSKSYFVKKACDVNVPKNENDNLFVTSSSYCQKIIFDNYDIRPLNTVSIPFCKSRSKHCEGNRENCHALLNKTYVKVKGIANTCVAEKEFKESNYERNVNYNNFLHSIRNNRKRCSSYVLPVLKPLRTNHDSSITQLPCNKVLYSSSPLYKGKLLHVTNSLTSETRNRLPKKNKASEKRNRLPKKNNISTRNKVKAHAVLLPPDDKLLVLPLLRLPHQVHQPKYCKAVDGYHTLSSKWKATISLAPVRSLFDTNANEKSKNILGKKRYDCKRSTLCVEDAVAPSFFSLDNKCRMNDHAEVTSDCVTASLQVTTSNSKSKSRMEEIEVIREIGRGSYGAVYLVKKSSNNKLLVLKTVKLSLSSEKEIDAARQEVHILSGLKHPNIVSYKGSFETNHHLHLLMGYCEGGDLYSRIRQQFGALFPEQQIIRWFIQITMALQYLHANNILHRDLKTQNIFLSRVGLIKLGDFGIARVLGSSVELASTMIGTPYYMSPELFAGIPYNYKSDMWALGCCLYELATLKHAFHARDMSALIYRISQGKVGDIPELYSEELKSYIQLLTSRTPYQRPSTSQILREPYIRHHMSAFLKDTMNPTTSSPKGGGQCKERDKVTGVGKLRTGMDDDSLQANQLVYQVKYPTNDYTNLEKEQDVTRPNLHARRCCEFLPTEFEHLQIAGDKMKLEDRPRMEPKQNGVKECNCYRQAKSNPSVTSHIDSQSRRRRRSNKMAVNVEVPEIKETVSACNVDNITPEKSLTVCNSDSAHSVPQTFLARARRREKRLKELEKEASANLMQQNNIQKDKERLSSENPESVSSRQLITDVCDADSSFYEDALEEPHTPKAQEVHDFVTMLDSTLHEDSSDDEKGVSDGNLTESNIEEQSTCDVWTSANSDLDLRMSLLKEVLVKHVGKEKAVAVVQMVKAGSWDAWEDQRKAVRSFLGEETFSPIATTVWLLKLSHSYMQE